MKTDQNPWIAYRYVKPKAAIRLFCFPYAGGGGSLFRAWSREAPQSVDVCAIQLPGRETRFAEPAFTDVALLVERLYSTMLPLLNIPFVFFGYSMGALIAFELARTLQGQSGLGLKHLFVAAS